MQTPRKLFYSLTVTIALGACGDEGNTVAEIDGQLISAEDLRRFVLTLPPGLRTTKTGQEARTDYLQTLIDRQLMQLEAREQGLTESPQLLAAVQRKVEDRVLGLYRQQDLYRDLQVSPEEVDSYIADTGLDVERLAEAILVDSEPEAWQLVRDLEGGQLFGDLAKERSVDRASGQRGGNVGYLNRLTAQRAGIPTAVFDSLQTGKVSPPLPLGRGWHVIRFIDDRNEIDPSVRTGIHTRLMREKRLEVEDEHVEALAHELGWALGDDGLGVLQTMADKTQSSPLSVEQRQSPVFRFEGGAITVENYLAALTEHRVGTTRALTERDFVASIGTRFLRNRAMLLVAAARGALQDEPAIVQWRSQIHDEMVLQALRKAVVAGADTMATDSLVMRYYEGRRENFRVPARICFDEVLVHDAMEAESVEAEIDDDTNLLDLSQARGYHVRRRNAEGLVCMKDVSAKVLPELWTALSAAPLGQIGGPIRLEEAAHILFKVAHRDPARLQTFAEAQRQVRASVTARLERQLFGEWLAQVRRKYESRIHIDAARLEGALPDALLAGAPVGGKA
jgi:parvulin-like peptidyl-prolyl isomerase